MSNAWSLQTLQILLQKGDKRARRRNCALTARRILYVPGTSRVLTSRDSVSLCCIAVFAPPFPYDKLCTANHNKRDDERLPKCHVRRKCRYTCVRKRTHPQWSKNKHISPCPNHCLFSLTTRGSDMRHTMDFVVACGDRKRTQTYTNVRKHTQKYPTALVMISTRFQLATASHSNVCEPLLV